MGSRVDLLHYFTEWRPFVNVHSGLLSDFVDSCRKNWINSCACLRL